MPIIKNICCDISWNFGTAILIPIEAPTMKQTKAIIFTNSVVRLAANGFCVFWNQHNILEIIFPHKFGCLSNSSLPTTDRLKKSQGDCAVLVENKTFKYPIVVGWYSYLYNAYDCTCRPRWHWIFFSIRFMHSGSRCQRLVSMTSSVVERS